MADFPDNFLRFNDQQTKQIAIVVEIEGVDLLSNRAVYTKIRYGDRGLKYGQPMLDGDLPVYGGLRKLDGVRDILSLDGSSLTISQRLENEQGKASISQLSMSFVDKDEYMSQVISPGIIIPEIMGRPVRVWLGYKECSFPEDYIVIFRGRITSVQPTAGLVTLQFSDPNFQRRQNIFSVAKTKILGVISPSDTTIPVLDNYGFYQHILGPDGFYDVANPWAPNGTYAPLTPKTTGVRTFLKVKEEFIEYGPLGFGTNTFTGCLRGARGTTPAAYVPGDEVSCVIQIEDHAIDMALKLMLSGWGKAWKKDVTVYSVMKTFDGVLLDQPRALILPINVDAVRDYGLTVGDYIDRRLSVIPSNNGTCRIVRFASLQGQQNRIIYVDQDMTAEFPTAMVMDFRSQFDTYPIDAGVALTPEDVDVDAHLTLKGSYLSDIANSYRFFITSREVCKSFIETEIYLPVSAYSLTQRGRLSVGYTKPPIADDTLLFLNRDNVQDPAKITVSRALNNRKFFNEVIWQYDYSDDRQPVSTFQVFDADSFDQIGVLSSLPINSRGARTDLGTASLFQKRSNFLLSRYRTGATLLDLKVDWRTGCQIEAGDIVAVQDEGGLKITNMQTGKRDLGVQLFEVVDRSLDHKNGQASLKLVSAVSSDVTDRYATFSPSSIVVSGDDTQLIIQDSFGPKYPGDEMRKWRDYVGQSIVIHDETYSFVSTTQIVGLDPQNNYRMFISGWDTPPSFFAGAIIDIPNYPDDPSKTLNSIYKTIHAFRSPTVAVVSGASPNQFDVGGGDIAKFFIGARLWIHKEDWSVYAADAKVADIIGNTIVLEANLAFTPDSTFFVSGIGFPDQAGFYRLI